MGLPWDGLPSHGYTLFFLEAAMDGRDSCHPMKGPSILLALILLALPSGVRAAPEALIALTAAYEKESLAALDPLTKRYVDSLHTLKLKYTQAGNLEGALAVDGEIKRMADDGDRKPAPDAGATLPDDLISLRNIYTASSARATDTLTGKYIGALETMKLQYTQLGNLEDAVAVDKELRHRKELLGASAPRIPASKIDVAKLAELKWRMPEKLLPGGESNRQWVQFAPNGRLVCGWNTANFNWKMSGDGHILFYPFKNRQKAVKFEWDNESPTATISTEDSSHKVTQFRR